MIGDPIIDAAIVLAGLLAAMAAEASLHALETVARVRLEELAENNSRRAEICLDLKSRIERVRGAAHISSMLILIAVSVITAHYFSLNLAFVPENGPITWAPAANRTIVVILTSLSVGVVFVALVSLAARAVGTHRAEHLVLKTAGFLLLLSRIQTLPARAITSIANLILRPIGISAQFADAVMSEEELMDIIEESTRSGLVDKTEHELIESIFRFTDKTAREIMIPRKEITAVEYDNAPEAILEQVVLDGYTRMPVYKGSLDNIVGVIYAKDVVSLIEHKDLIILDDIIRPPFVVPDTKPISDLLREFQRKRIHLAVVVDEFGGTEGLITLEDILEEIVGDIHDEYDEDARYWDMFPGGVVEVEGRLTISDFNSLFPITIPESGEYDTIGGFITSLMGRIPEKADGTDWHGFRIDILDVDGRRIIRARFTPLEDAQA